MINIIVQLPPISLICNMNLIDKFYEEHRVAYPAIVEIEKSKESPQVRTEKILKLFESELLPHFRQEEDELFTDDFGSKVLMKEHNQVYALIEKMKAESNERYIRQFCILMKNHIKTEEEYFRSLDKKNNILPYIVIAFLAFIAGIIISKVF